MTADGDRKDGSGEITIESRIERWARGERWEKLHPFESYPRTPSGLKKSIKRREARRVEGDNRRGWKELKKERKRWGWEDHRADCSVKWMKRGKTKRQRAKDGTCSNQGISRYTYIFFFQFIPFFLLIYFVAYDSIPSFDLVVIIYILLLWKIHQGGRFDNKKKCKILMQREKSNNKKEKNIAASRKMQNFYHAVFLCSRPAERMLKNRQ